MLLHNSNTLANYMSIFLIHNEYLIQQHHTANIIKYPQILIFALTRHNSYEFLEMPGDEL